MVNYVNLQLLADEINISMDQLLHKLADIGIIKTKHDVLTNDEKKMLFESLYKNPNSNVKTFVLQRKRCSTLNFSTINGKNKSIPVEVRKKHIYLKNDIEKNIVNNISLELSQQRNKELSSDQLINKKKLLIKSLVTRSIYDTNTNQLDKKYKMKDRKRKSSISPRIVIDEKIKLNNKLQNWITENNKNTFFSNKSLRINFRGDKKDLLLKNNRRDNIINNKNISKKNRFDFISNKNSLSDKKNSLKNNKINFTKNSSSLLFKQHFKKPLNVINRDIILRETISISDLAKKMAVKVDEVIKTISMIGGSSDNNQILDQDMAQLVAEEMGHKVILYCNDHLEQSVIEDRLNQDCKKINNRAPIVTIMGHVDHGKTSLLDYIRSSNVVQNESGGITQHIGAYHVKTDSGIITFLDTPGHSAFTAMRARGVKTTDIVVLVVAADDGVKPQTIEAIQHAKAAKVPILVAINKIDKINSNLKDIKNQLMKYEIVSEEWGGDTIFVNVSAKTGEGVNELLHSILLQSELLELSTNFDGMATGVVIESCLDKGRGPVATVLVKEGSLSKGNIVLCGIEYGRIRALLDERGREIESAGPSIPVEILGLSGVPLAGDIMDVVKHEKIAREVSFNRKDKNRLLKLSMKKNVNLENMFKNVQDNKVKELNIILKTDVQGSLEAILDSLSKISHDEIEIKVIGSGVGGITETDVSLALASSAIIIGFNVRADNTARRLIKLENLDLRYYSVIYELLNEIKMSMSGMLSPEYKQKIIGLAIVRNVFQFPKIGYVAGCMVTEGSIKKNQSIRILRDNIVIYEGELESLRRFKDDVQEVKKGMECGVGVKNYNDIRINDVIEVFKIISVKRMI
ncbi:MAG: translation initiation factor IF-2 [Buchnera aphidicola (Eriosoma harunire)]